RGGTMLTTISLFCEKEKRFLAISKEKKAKVKGKMPLRFVCGRQACRTVRPRYFVARATAGGVL
ncbi:MAG: hypothetical protein RSC86_07515, partial [Oscillospiraceae bacterium]